MTGPARDCGRFGRPIADRLPRQGWCGDRSAMLERSRAGRRSTAAVAAAILKRLAAGGARQLSHWRDSVLEAPPGSAPGGAPATDLAEPASRPRRSTVSPARRARRHARAQLVVLAAGRGELAPVAPERAATSATPAASGSAVERRARCARRCASATCAGVRGEAVGEVDHRASRPRARARAPSRQPRLRAQVARATSPSRAARAAVEDGQARRRRRRACR